MASPADFYGHLLLVLEQIPPGCISTHSAIADALGDPAAAKAVKEPLERERFARFKGRTAESPQRGAEVFSGFSSERPLEQLARYQREQAGKVILEDDYDDVNRIAGVDVSYRGDVAASACVVVGNDLEVIECASTVTPVAFPYIPGYLMFREGPAIEAVTEHVSGFDVVLVNGHGAAHPRGCGLASDVGLRLDVPALGVAKGLLVGELRIGGTEVMHEGKVVAAEISRPGHAPLYVSPGHRISLRSSVEIVEMTAGPGQLPEPLRLAHLEARRLMRGL